MFGRLLSWYTIYTFGGCCPLTEFCSVQSSLYVQVLSSLILAALLHGTPAVGVSQTLRCGTRNGITELSQTAPPIFGWAAIMLGIGPHSSFVCIPFELQLVLRKQCVMITNVDENQILDRKQTEIRRPNAIL